MVSIEWWRKWKSGKRPGKRESEKARRGEERTGIREDG
jgi:hypothetical protein